MAGKRTTFIATVLNEELSIERFLNSLHDQTVQPDEIIIADGGSADDTVKLTKDFSKKYSLPVRVLHRAGNRAIGRNFAIKNASHEYILCADAGCILDKDWVKNITKPIENGKANVVAGYYKGKAETIFQECIVPYILIMPDKVNQGTFLPATRSMAFTKAVWKKVGGFPEKYSHNEDYVFARKLKKEQAKIVFSKDSIVYWIPPKTIRQVFRTFWRFAYGDAEAGIIRPKVVLIFLRYLIGILLNILYFYTHNSVILLTFTFLLLTYITWSIQKNYNYVRKPQALYLLPFMQILTDIAVISGSILGIIHYRWDTQRKPYQESVG